MNSPASSPVRPTRLCLTSPCFSWRGLFLPLALALVACGGPDFTAFERVGDDALAGAGGEAPSTGGASGSGTTTGGSGGAVVPLGGSSGTGGAPAGGAAGSGATGPTEPSCAPEEAIVFPESFSWNGFVSRWDDVDQSYCASSAGGLCTFRNATLEHYETPTRVVFRSNLDCTFQIFSGVCGEESACDGGFSRTIPASVHMLVLPAGDGYRLDTPDQNPSRFATVDPPQACAVQTSHGTSVGFDNAIVIDAQEDFFALLESSSFPCL